MRHWRARALTIPDGPLRVDAIHSLTRKRANADGSALFSILAPSRDTELLRLLVAYESIWDFLDNVSERGACVGTLNGRHLHRALLDAIDPQRGVSAYYRHHPWRDDAGYMQVLVDTCRGCCLALPSYRRVRQPLIEEARRSDVGAFNHELDPAQRESALKRWAEPELRRLTDAGEVAWYELSAAASCSAAAHVLLALAANPDARRSEVEEVYAAYFPWFSLATTMLDSYVDQVEDIAGGAHSYISHYPSGTVAEWRIREAIERSTHALCALREGPRHAVIAACMVAMYASKDSAREPHMRATTASLVCAGGPLARLLVPVLRLWRVVYGQQSA
jgi:tetraprenyl-beta-curcumene synthase